MNCEQFESLLNEVLDQRESPQEEIRLAGHAAACPPCAELLEVYTALGQLQTDPAFEPNVTATRSARGYVVAALAATILAVLLGPVSEFFPRSEQRLNLAHADPQPLLPQVLSPESEQRLEGPLPAAQSINRESNGNQIGAARPIASLEGWGWRMPPGLVVPTEFPLADPRRFVEMGESLNHVWKSIQGEQYLLPLLKQGALFWVP